MEFAWRAFGLLIGFLLKCCALLKFAEFNIKEERPNMDLWEVIRKKVNKKLKERRDSQIADRKSQAHEFPETLDYKRLPQFYPYRYNTLKTMKFNKKWKSISNIESEISRLDIIEIQI